MYSLRTMLLVVLLFAGMHGLVWGQCPPTNLETDLKAQPTIPDKIDLLKKAARNCKDAETDIAIQLANRALLLARREGLHKEEAVILNTLGLCYKSKSNFDAAIQQYAQSIVIARQIKDSTLLSRSFANMAAAFSRVGRIDSALQYALHNLAIKKAIGDEEELAKAQNLLGNIYNEILDYDKALYSYTIAHNIFEALHQQKHLATVKYNIGNVYYGKEEFEPAIKWVRESLDIRTQLNDTAKIAMCHGKLGSLFCDWQHPDSAMVHFLVSLNLFSDLKKDYELTSVLHNMGQLQANLGNHKLAMHYFDQALVKAKFTQSTPHLREIYNSISGTLATQQKYQAALDTYKLYAALSDTIYKIQYDTTTQKLLHDLEIQRRDAIAEAETYELRVWLVIIIALFVITVLSLFFFRQKVKRDIDAAILKATEHRQMEIGEMLHGKIGSKLATINLILEEMRKNVEGSSYKATEQLEKVIDMLTSSMATVRQLSHNLAASSLKRLGLAAALADTKDYLEASEQLEVELNIFGLKDDIPKSIANDIYFIVQECISNILHHAEARHISIQLNQHDQHLNLMVADDGKGFDVNEAKQKRGLGISNIQARTKRNKGTLNIDSTKGHGSAFVIDIPLPK